MTLASGRHAAPAGPVLITGCSSGVGRAAATIFRAAGYETFATARDPSTLDDLRALGCRTLALDVTDETARRAAVDAIEREFGAVGVLVNNAGFGYAGRFDLLDGERLRRLLRVNTEAPLILTHALVQGMRQRGRGGVVFTGSVAAHQPLPLHAVYAATKAFGASLGEALWAELRASNIDVLVLEPGTTETEFQSVAGEIPHPGQPADEVAALALRSLGEQPSVIAGWYNWLRANAVGRLLTRPIAALGANRYMTPQTPEDLR